MKNNIDMKRDPSSSEELNKNNMGLFKEFIKLYEAQEYEKATALFNRIEIEPWNTNQKLELYLYQII